MGGLKKSKMLIVFFMVLICCTGMLMGAISADSASQTASGGTASAQRETTDEKPHLTWEAIKNLLDGSLEYKDIMDSYYYKEIGSGFYIISFPITGTSEFSLIMRSVSPNAEPVAVGLRCEFARLSLELNEKNLGFMMELYNNGRGQSLPAKKDDTGEAEQDVRALVEAFGKTLGKVSLLAPKDIAAAGIKENYGNYIMPELLQKWQADPLSAPGRTVSSPWPDRIEILRAEMIDKNQYSVYGEIMEVTGVEAATSGAAAKRPVTVNVQMAGGRWLISGVTIGGYIKQGPVVYENNIYGFRFYLPESWKGYKIVGEQWEGTYGSVIVETGPQLLIRHPKWTQKNQRQDIPIMVFTLEQWNALQKGEFFIGAAPIGPGKLGSNSSYVFALPARYNYAFPTGFEEVEEILKGNPLWPSKKAVAGLLDTELNIRPVDNKFKLDISLRNISKEDIKLDFDLGREYDFVVINKKGEEIYRWSHGKDTYLPAITHNRLKKGEKLTFSADWDGMDNDGRKVPAGKYSITLILNARIENGKNVNPDELKATKDIEVKNTL